MGLDGHAMFLVKSIVLPDPPRREMGDLEDLLESMPRLGQLVPIVLGSNNELVDGERRLRAAIKLGWTHILAIPIDRLDTEDLKFQAEYDANVKRKPLTPSEAIAQGERYAKSKQTSFDAAKKARQGNLKQNAKSADTDSGNLPESVNLQEDAHPEPVGEVDEYAAKMAEMSRKSYQKGRQVVKAAEAEPELYGDIRKEMDETGNIDGAHKKLVKKQQEQSHKRDAMFDELGKEVPSDLRDRFGDRWLDSCANELEAQMKTMDKIRDLIRSMCDNEKWLLAGESLHNLENCKAEANAARSLLLAARPHAVCPLCAGKRCKECRKSGYVPQWRLAELKQTGAI